MRKTFSNHSEVCHVWAQQTQDEGRASNIYFHGRIIYSYGAHYKMACFHASRDNDTPFVLINSSGYSSSTAKHTYHVRRAVEHLLTIDCPNVDPQTAQDHKNNIGYFAECINHAQVKAMRARSNMEFWQEQAYKLAVDHNNYIKHFGLDEKLIDTDALFSDEQKAIIRERIEKQRLYAQEERKRAEARQAERMKILAVELDRWEKGGSSHYNLYEAPVRLRVMRDTENSVLLVETSHGARVTAQEALNLIEAINMGKNVLNWDIGHFTVNELTEEMLVVGCHKIPMAEVRKIERLLLEGVPA